MTAMTLRGHELLKDELKRLKSVDRPNVIQAIAEARAHGDLKENAEYHAAKEQQGFIEGRIKEIEGKLSKLSHLQVIDVTEVDARGKVIFGSTVELLEESTGKEIEYRIVGEDEADIGAGLISYTSPIARALIGQNEGDVITFAAPDGEKQFEIIEVRQLDSLFLRVFAKQQRHVANALHEFRTARIAETRDDPVALRAITNLDTDLDEFVVLEAAIEFR
jgi:transcription elongation factor GreA